MAMSPEEEKDKFIPEVVLGYPNAREAFNQLVNSGCSPQHLGFLLSLMVIFGNRKTSLPWLPRRRVLDTVISKVSDLASQIRDLYRYPGILKELFANTKTPTEIDHPLDPLLQLPALLDRHANVLEGARSKRPPKREPRARTTDIYRLLDYVKNATGRSQFEAVAQLLEPVYTTLRGSSPDATALRQLAYRKRSRTEKLRKDPDEYLKS